MLRTHRVTQGDRKFLRFTLLKDGQPWPVDGWSWLLTVKASVEDADETVLLQVSSDEDKILPHPTDRTSVYAVLDPDTTKDKEPGRYVYDMQGTSPEGDPTTTEVGVFILEPEITRT